MKETKKLIFVLLGIVFWVVLFPLNASAENILDSFTIEAVKPVSQINEDVSYFDLLLEPNQKETLKVIVKNNKDTEIELKPSINQAVTNSSGVVEYSGQLASDATSAPLKINEIAKLNTEEIKLKPHEKKELSITIEMPDKTFKGIVAGAIYMIEEPKEQVEGSIRNILSREIAIVIRTEKEDVEPELVFKEIKAIQSNKRNALEILMENTAATYIKKVNVTYEIHYKEKEFLKGEKVNLKIAPNSELPLTIPLDGKAFNAGDYSSIIKVTSGEYSWEEELPFTVDQSEATSLNKSDVSDKTETVFPWLTVLLIGLFVILGIFIVYLLKRTNKLEQQLKRRKRKRRKRRKNR
ncbi:DUF916 and DUF3324 domain-containing protein [Enterococcus sp. LJL99]